jgi:hypothetical protein
MVARRGRPPWLPEPCPRLRVRRAASWEPMARFCGSACARPAKEGPPRPPSSRSPSMPSLPRERSPSTEASFTKVQTVTLTLSATDASGLADICISNVPSCSTWLPFAKTKSWSLPAGDGVKPVYAWFPVLLPLSALRACRGIHGGGSTTRVSSVASGRLGRRGVPAPRPHRHALRRPDRQRGDCHRRLRVRRRLIAPAGGQVLLAPAQGALRRLRAAGALARAAPEDAASRVLAAGGVHQP